MVYLGKKEYTGEGHGSFERYLVVSGTNSHLPRTFISSEETVHILPLKACRPAGL